MNAVFEQALEKEWFIQGFNGYPLFLNRAAVGGFEMAGYYGKGYTEFFVHYSAGGYAEYGYLQKDLDDLGAFIAAKLVDDSEYLHTARKEYREMIDSHLPFLQHIHEEIAQSDNLVLLLKQAIAVLDDSARISHIQEPVSMMLEDQFRSHLQEALKKKGTTDQGTMNDLYAALSTPTEPSFIAMEEQALCALQKLSGDELENALNTHIAQYHWVQNTYCGAGEVTVDSLQKRMRNIHAVDIPMRLAQVRERKQQIIGEYALSEQMQQTIELIDFMTIWQDRRKADIFKAISAIDAVVHALAEKLQVAREVLYYLSVEQVEDIDTEQDVLNIQKDLQLQAEGMCVYLSPEKEELAVGADCAQIQPRWKAMMDDDEQKTDFRGQIANTGTAIGRVRICRDLASIAEVEEGDVIVASMTRPEFMPALRKAAAIVTDEGGITSHAAIVSRELGIPAVIGTKVATRVLQNGMLVEVRANHGLVKILT